MRPSHHLSCGVSPEPKSQLLVWLSQLIHPLTIPLFHRALFPWTFFFRLARSQCYHQPLVRLSVASMVGYFDRGDFDLVSNLIGYPLRCWLVFSNWCTYHVSFFSTVWMYQDTYCISSDTEWRMRVFLLHLNSNFGLVQNGKNSYLYYLMADSNTMIFSYKVTFEVISWKISLIYF